MRIADELFSKTFPLLVAYLKAAQVEKDAAGRGHYTPIEKDDLIAVLQKPVGNEIASLPAIVELLDIYFSQARQINASHLPDILANGAMDSVGAHYLFEHGTYFDRQWYTTGPCCASAVVSAYQGRTPPAPVPSAFVIGLAESVATPGETSDALAIDILSALHNSGPAWADAACRDALFAAVRRRIEQTTNLQGLQDIFVRRIPCRENHYSILAAELALTNTQLHTQLATIEPSHSNDVNGLIYAAFCGSDALQRTARKTLRGALERGHFLYHDAGTGKELTTQVSTCTVLQMLLKDEPGLFDTDTLELADVKPSLRTFREFLKTRALGPQEAAKRATSETAFAAVKAAFPLIKEEELFAMCPSQLKRSRVRSQASGMAF